MHEILSKIVLLRNNIILVIIVKINNLEEHRIYRLIDTFQLNDTSVVQQPLSTVVYPHITRKWGNCPGKDLIAPKQSLYLDEHQSDVANNKYLQANVIVLI